MDRNTGANGEAWRFICRAEGLARDLREFLENAWGADTAHPSRAGSLVPSAGQCYVSTMALAEQLADEPYVDRVDIVRGSVTSLLGTVLIGDHSWAEIQFVEDEGSGICIDLTLDQAGCFPKVVVFRDTEGAPARYQAHTACTLSGVKNEGVWLRYFTLTGRLARLKRVKCST